MEPSLGPPNADSVRQAIHAIRGYEYQILAAALAWVDLEDDGLIYLEVAEDYAHVVGGDIEAVQVKETRGSGAVTLNTPAVRDAIQSFVELTGQNPTRKVHLRFLTTAPIGLERSPDVSLGGVPGLEYWKRARAGREDVGPLRTILERESSPETVRTFCRSRTDEGLLADLIRRITWDCDRPDTVTLRRELEERVSLFLRKEFDVPRQDALPVVDVLASHVLRRSAVQDARARVLTRQELHELADSSTRVSLPRTVLERLLSKALVPSHLSTSEHATVSARGLAYPPWIVDATILPTHKVHIRREALETLVQSALRATGLCFVVGPTGTGKSILARCVAAMFPGPIYWIDLRDTELSEAQNRLKQVFVLLAEIGPATLMLEDLNCLTAAPVQISLGEVVGAARRRDMRIVVTSYGRPTATLLNRLSVDSQSVVSSPHFDLTETRELVSTLGGDAEVWGGVSHLAGSAGHPQLTYAFVAGMARRGWPKHEIDEVIARGLTHADLEDEQGAARADLIASLPDAARDLLYRLTIAVTPFDRSLAIAIGTTEPPIARAGEFFDELVDRWLEPAIADRYRPSPLVRGVGPKMLTTGQQSRVHDRIATELSDRDPMEAVEIDAILFHGLAGASQASLVKLTVAINLADDETRQAIARLLALFPALDTSKPIYPKHSPTSVMLRLAQLRLVTATENPRGVDDVVQALLSEIDALPAGPMRSTFESAALSAVLNNLGIARNLTNWVSLLSRFRRLNLTGHEAIVPPHMDVTPAAILFSIGIAGLDSVEKLAAVFDALSELEYDERRELLTPVDPSVQDHFLLVHHPWTVQSRRPGFDATEAINSYMKMSAHARSWGTLTLSIQCHVAVVMILDEHLDDPARALHALAEAAGKFGRHPLLARSFGRLHRRLGHGTQALGHYRDAVSEISMFAPLNGVYALREAAVCAAECGEWQTARTWFLQAHAASDPQNDVALAAIKVGLQGDAAVASFQAGDLPDALTLFKDTLLSLAAVEPDSNLQAAHSHRVIRHAILWLKAKVEGRDVRIADEPITMLPGACSNPEPVPAIAERLLGPIDFAWYMLAEVELTSSLDVGVREIVKQVGVRGCLPGYEHMFRTQVLEATISGQNPVDFVLYFSDYLASATYFVVNREAIRRSSSILASERVVIPELPHTGPYGLVTEHSAQRAILAYGVRSLLVGGADGVKQICDGLRQEFGDAYPGSSLFATLDSASTDGNALEREVALLVRRCQMTGQPPPYLIFLTGLRLLTWIARSPFQSVLLPCLKPWLSANWERILRTQQFYLHSPGTTAPPILEVLQSELDSEPFAATLTLVAEAAVGVPLDTSLREDLELLAHGVSARR